MILTHSKVYLVKDSYSTLKKCFLGKRQRNVQLEDSPSEQKAVKYEENMYAIVYRGKAIQIKKNEGVCRCTCRGVCVSVCLSVCLWQTERNTYVWYMCVWPLWKVCCCHLTPFEKPKLGVIKHASFLNHGLLNMYLIFFITSNASVSNYLANKDRIKTSSLRKRKLHSTHNSHLSCNSIISFILGSLQPSPNKPVHFGQIPRQETY